MDIDNVAPKSDSSVARVGRADKQAATASELPTADNKLPGKSSEPVANPVISMDASTGAVILEFKNNGEKTFQLPSKTTLQYQEAQNLAAEHKAGDKGVV